MPRGDGTGPMGIGPMTGRGLGNCTGYKSSGFANRGIGFGRGKGGGCGYRRSFWYSGISNLQVMDDKTILKNQEELLEKQLRQVKDSLKIFDEQK